MIVTDILTPDKVLVAGDWHGNGAWAQKVIHYARKSGAQAIVHAGDFGWWVNDHRDTHKYLGFVQKVLDECSLTLYWVDGNHEDHDYIDGWVEATEGAPWSHRRYPNIVHLPRGYRWEWSGKTWMSLGGAHSVDRPHRVPGKSWWDAEHISDAQMERAIRGGPVDVMVTHDCPAGVEIPGIHAAEKLDSTKSFWPASELIASDEHRKRLREVVDSVQPAVLFHGHYHVNYQSVLRRRDGLTQVIGLDMDSTTLERNTILANVACAAD